MKTSGMYSAFTVSIFFHVVLFSFAVIIAQHITSNQVKPYIVSLVDVAATGALPAGKSTESQVPRAEPKPKKQPEKAPVQKQTDSPVTDEGRVMERITALQAKKRIERIVALRKVVDISGQRADDKRQQAVHGVPPSIKEGDSRIPTQGAGSKDYDSLVIESIRRHWIFPESIDRDLEAIVSIKIARDGSVSINKMEKSSGSILFDRSALKAISNASPLPPPPKEMEMGVRFRP